DFAGRLPLGAGLDGAFIKSVEKAHFGHGVFLGAGERAAVLFRPEIERGLIHKDFERKGGLAVNRNDIRELAPRGSSALAATALKEVILIHEAVSSGIAFDAADGIRASHAGIIRGRTREVNARGCREG